MLGYCRYVILLVNEQEGREICAICDKMNEDKRLTQIIWKTKRAHHSINMVVTTIV